MQVSVCFITITSLYLGIGVYVMFNDMLSTQLYINAYIIGPGLGWLKSIFVSL